MSVQLKILGLMVLVSLLSLSVTNSAGDSSAFKLLKRREEPAAGPAKSSVAVPPSRAQQFLSKLSRTKRNLWDRSRPDVQQWIMQFMYLGYDEQRLETDLSYWMDQARTGDQGRQHHYDENSPLGPRDQNSYRHGADVNYDYY